MLNDKFTKEDLIKLYQSGKTMKEVAKMYGISDDTLHRRHLQSGINIRDYKMSEQFKKFTKDELISFYKSGLTMVDLQRKYKISQYLVRYMNEKYGINLNDYKEYRVDYNVLVFDIIDTEAKAYWLGFLYADGCVRKNSNEIKIELAAIDRNHLIKFKNFMEDTRSEDVIKHRDRVSALGNPQSMESYQLCSPILKNSLINLGCVPKKSLILVFPDINIFKDSNLIYDFIRGYIDGDGCLSINKNSLMLSARGTQDFLQGICNIFPNEFKKIYSEIDKRTQLIQYKICCSGKNAQAVATKLYSNATIYLDRKFEKATLYGNIQIDIGQKR